MRRSGIFAPIAIAAVMLTGCGGGAHTSSPAALPSGAPALTQQGARAQATFRIDVPKSSAALDRRSAQYVSPATTKMLIDIKQSGVSIAGYPVTVGLTPSSGGCTSTLANTYCQLTVAIAPGSYTATLTTEDASSTPLSTAQSIAFTITAGANNIIPITLSGIPHSLQATTNAIAVHGSSNEGFKLYGAAAQPIIVRALDADGNIIAGPGSPSYSASVLSGSGWSATAPTSTAPNTIAITPPGTNGAGATIALTASYSDATCSQPGAVCSTTFTIKNDIQTLFIGGYDSGGILALQSPYSGAGTNLGSAGAYALVADAAGDVFAADPGNHWVTEYAAPYTGTATTTITNGVNVAAALALDGAGNLFVANGTNVTEYARPYTGAPITTITGLSDPWALAIDGLGNLAVANLSGPSGVEVYAPPYTGTPTTITTGVSGPYALAFDRNADLFVANTGSGTITEYAPPYTAVTASMTVNSPVWVAVDNGGTVFASNNNISVEIFTPPYTGAPTTIADAGGYPENLAIDGAGNLFIANSYTGTVTEYVPPYTNAPVRTIAAPNAYALWITP